MAEDMVPQSRAEEILIATINGTEYEALPQSRLEYLLLELKATIEAGGSGTMDYNALINRPKINGETLEGNKSAEDLNLEKPLTNEQITALLELIK